MCCNVLVVDCIPPIKCLERRERAGREGERRGGEGHTGYGRERRGRQEYRAHSVQHSCVQGGGSLSGCRGSARELGHLRESM